MRETLKSGKGKRWSFLERFDIPDRHNPSEVYLRRWYIVQTPWFSILLHKILLADSDYHLHDHPWNFINIILKNSYIEKIPGKLQNVEFDINVRRRFSIGRKRAEDLHSILHLNNDSPVWTLLFTGVRRRDWGFQTEDGWIHYEDYFERY